MREFIRRHRLNDVDFLIMCFGIAAGIAGCVVGAFPWVIE